MTNIALIGVGSWGKNFLKAVLELKKLHITHICAYSEKTLSQFPDSYYKTTDYRSLTHNKSIAGVIIATPPQTHLEIASAFIKQKIPCLVEKPFTTNFIDAKKLIDLSVQQNTLVMVGHEYLYNPAFLYLKKILSKVGSIQFIATEAGNFGPIRENVTTLWDWGPHDVSMLIGLLDELPISVQAWGSDDVIYANLRFKKISAYMNLCRRIAQKTRRLQIIGEKDTILYDELEESKIFFKNSTNTKLNFSTTPPLVYELLAFCDMIINKKSSQSGSRHILKVMQVLDALERSLGEKGRIIVLE